MINRRKSCLSWRSVLMDFRSLGLLKASQNARLTANPGGETEHQNLINICQTYHHHMFHIWKMKMKMKM